MSMRLACECDRCGKPGKPYMRWDPKTQRLFRHTCAECRDTIDRRYRRMTEEQVQAEIRAAHAHQA